MPEGIPTTYAGIRFRSRLEAMWAAFFDRLSWPWQYEPLDLQGYIPDFVLPFRGGGPLLVEVKPEFTLDGLEFHVAPIQHSGWEHNALLVGTEPIQSSQASMALGLIGRRWEADSEWIWEPALLVLCRKCASWAVAGDSWEQCWADSTVCPPERWKPGGRGDVPRTKALWADAKNTVQWRGRRA